MQKVIDPAASGHAVLSHRPCQHLPNFRFAHPTTLDQSDHHGQITDDVGIEAHLLAFPGPPAPAGASAALAVLQFLLLFAFCGAVVGHAALGGISPAVRLAASKRTPQIPAPRIPEMGQEENPTLPATAQTGPQMSVGAEDRTQLDVVRPHQSADATAAVPVRDALKLLLDFDD